jgi:hypothetical protein
MAMQTTSHATSDFSALRSGRDWLFRVGSFIASMSSAVACAREAERLMQMSDEELARRGLSRDGIVQHAFAKHMAC